MLGAPNCTKSLPILHNLNIDSIKTEHYNLSLGFYFIITMVTIKAFTTYKWYNI